MARKKPARPAAKKGKKKATSKAASRKRPKKAVKKAVKKAAKKARKAPARKVKAKARPKAAPRKAAKKPNLDRPRKTVADIHNIPSSLGAVASSSSSAKSGRAGAKHKLHEHTSSSPAMTAGDVDADWASADSTGDEAPGGDNPTPDQDVVDEIGRALGVEYADDEELQGGEEIVDRDKHRWELDPSSKDDDEDTE